MDDEADVVNRGAARNFHRVAAAGSGAVNYAAEVVVAARLVERGWTGVKVVLPDGRRVPVSELLPQIASARFSAFGRKMPVGETAGRLARARRAGIVESVSARGVVIVKYDDGSRGVFRRIRPDVKPGQKVETGSAVGQRAGRQRTLEGDMVGDVGDEEIFFDLKNYQGSDIELSTDDLAKAINGINRNTNIGTVVFLAPGQWSAKSRAAVVRANENELRLRIAGSQRNAQIVLAELDADDELLDFVRHHVDEAG
jgi:hypothetical protein